ncbi:MAG: NFACT RNA binding domain-containing protein [Planctomycetota bacterium]
MTGAARPWSLRAPHLAELLDELRPLLVGARIRGVDALPPRDLLLVVERAEPQGPRLLRLRLSANPDAPRIHLQVGRVPSHSGPQGPFFRRLAEELCGACIAGLDLVGGDRIVILELTQTPRGGRRALLAELVGRHSNLVLLGPGDEVLEVLVPAPASKRGQARLVTGRAWGPPGGFARGPEKVQPPPLQELLPAPDAPHAGRLPRDAPDTPHAGRLADQAPLSWRVEFHLGGQAARLLRARIDRRLAERLARKLSRARSLLAGLEQRSTAASGSQRVRQDGELLKAHLSRLRRGLSHVELEDWFTDSAPLRRIELDPRRSPLENMERLFARYSKLERARSRVASELERAHARLAGLLEFERARGLPDADPAALETEAEARGLLDARQEADLRKRRAPAPRLPYRTFVVHGGKEVWVGRGARDNDVLTFRIARGNDLWLHTADCPGSHVILRLGKGQEPDPRALEEAALLAVHFSPARDRGFAPVHVARRKEVHKPRGAKPGLVTLSGGRILEVQTQQARLEGLLRSRRDAGRGGTGTAPPDGYH